MTERPGQGTETLEQQHARVIHEFCTLLLDLAAQGPLVVGIDDVQYADRLSLQFLSSLTRRLAAKPILLVLNEWAVLEPALDSFRAELLSHSHCRRIRLGPLSPAGVAELLADHADTWPSSPPHTACAAISGGNPLLIRALLEDHARVAGRISAKAPAGPVVADAFREAVLVCVHRCGPDVLEGAQGLTVLGDAGTPALLARLLDIEPPQADHVVEVLTMAGLLADGHFRHPAARAAVLDNIAGKDRTRLHRRAAGLLYQEGAQATTVAAHLITCDQTDAPWTVPVLREAAPPPTDTHPPATTPPPHAPPPAHPPNDPTPHPAPHPTTPPTGTTPPPPRTTQAERLRLPGRALPAGPGAAGRRHPRRPRHPRHPRTRRRAATPRGVTAR